MVFLYQRALIFPGARSRGTAEAHVEAAPGTELLELRAAGRDRVAALFGPALRMDGEPHPDAARLPTLLYCYGNGMSLRIAQEQLDHFRRSGANVLIPEYVGYGMSTGRAGEAECYATADAAYRHLQERGDVDPRRIVAAGWSLGGAVAIDLAARREVAGLVTFSTFTSMGDVARRRYPYLPISLLLRHRFENETKIREIACPLLLVHGTADPLVPFSMADRLAAAATGPVTRVSVADAAHNDVFVVGGPQIFTALRQFLQELHPPAAPVRP